MPRMILKKNSVDEFFTSIKQSNSICILGHKSPDGDCIGSVMALYEFITINYDKNVYYGFDGKIPYNLVSYVDEKIILNNFEDMKFDLLIVLDCADKERLGKYGCITDNSKKVICIDHHKTNTLFAQTNIIDSQISSTGELLYHILKYNNNQISLKMAELIYIAIITDTGKFAYSSTSKETHMVAAELIELGIDVSEIDTKIYNSKPYNIVNAYIQCISNIKFYYNNKLGIAKITKKIINDNNIDMNDIEGVVEFIREINETEISCVLKEFGENDTKVSLRAKNDFIDVAEISTKYSGGGHKKAAGFQLNQGINNAEKIVVEEFKAYLGE